MTFRIDIQQAKSLADCLIDFLDPWAWGEDIRHRMANCLIGIDIHVTGPAYAEARVDTDLKCFLDYLLSGEPYYLSRIDYRSGGDDWEDPEPNIPNYFPSDFLFYERREPIGESTLRTRFFMEGSHFFHG